MPLHRAVAHLGYSPASEIVSDLLNDLTDRRGFRQQWDACDPDTQQEIAEKWVSIVQKKLGTTPRTED